MSLEQSFRRLALQPKSVCHQCRRAFGSSSRAPQQTQATAALADLMQASRNENRQRTTAPSRPVAVAAASPLNAPSSRAPPAAGNRDSYALAERVIQQSKAATQERNLDARVAEQMRSDTRRDLDSQLTRRWKAGDIYAPHDLSGVEMSKWKKIRRKPRTRSGDRDVLDQLGINPLKDGAHRNFSMMAEYVTEMGRIRHSSETGLRPVNQRRMAKAIRRAIGMGLMPSVYRHPELLREELNRNAGIQQRGGF